MARGYVVSRDPTKLVGGIQFGPHFLEVHVCEVLRPCEPLMRPFEHHLTIGDAVDENIAWLYDDVLNSKVYLLCLHKFNNI